MIIDYFANLRIIDYIDILLVGLLIYQAFKIIRGTAAMSIFVGIVVIYFVYLLTRELKMVMLSSLLGSVMSVGVLPERSYRPPWSVSAALNGVSVVV